ncbi:MAG TPA: hypothetical protein VES38_07650 [Methylotenera sp.]|nr:hypothetical protein [Methylotenera sp.]
MKHLSKQTSLLLSVTLAVGALTVIAKTSPTFDIHTSVISKAAQSEKGVILVLTERGSVAAEAAYMLSAQVKQNEGFLPLLMVAEKNKVAGYMGALALPTESLPAVIFFDKSGKELARVVASKPEMIRSAQYLNRVS